ncbi:hypothetical protein ABZZ80_40415 [Streptomyces sp. NPDC006356]
MGSLHQFTPTAERLAVAAFRTGARDLHCRKGDTADTGAPATTRTTATET